MSQFGVARSQITTPTPASGKGVLSVASGVAPANLNLSTDGPFDWVCVSPNNSGGGDYIPTSWRWKLNNGELGRNIRGVTSAPVNGEGSGTLGPISLSVNAGDDGADASDNFTGVGAAPLTNVSSWRGLFGAAGVTGFGWKVSCLSTPTVRTLKLYVKLAPAVAAVGVQVKAHLVDGSAADALVNLATVGATPQTNVITIQFASKVPSQLVVTALVTANTGTNGEIQFIAATIS